MRTHSADSVKRESSARATVPPTSKDKPVLLQRGISDMCHFPGARLTATRQVNGEQKTAAWFHHGLVQFNEKLGGAPPKPKPKKEAVLSAAADASLQPQVRAHDWDASIAARPRCASIPAAICPLTFPL